MDNQKIILDTSPLILFLVGSFNPSYLSKIKDKNRAFSKNDFDTFSQYIQNKKILVTPQILAEMCNITQNYLGQDLFKQFMESIFALLKDGTIEVYHKKEDLMTNLDITKWGFSDMSIFFSSSVDNKVIVSDFPLYGYLEKEGKNVEFLDTILSPNLLYN